MLETIWKICSFAAIAISGFGLHKFVVMVVASLGGEPHTWNTSNANLF
jgi:hypothetical protein